MSKKRQKMGKIVQIIPTYKKPIKKQRIKE